MISLGDAILYLRGDNSKLDQSLGDAEKKAEGFAGRAGGFIKNAFSFATGGLIQAGIQGIAGSIGGLAEGMIKGNAQFETYETQFGVLLGGADKAKERLAALATFGATTPFELPQVVEADKILQGFGLHSDEAAKKFGFSGEQIRTIAGDVASGTGSSFSEMTLLLGKFSTGATGEAISRMAELGITSRAELAKMGLEFDKSGALLSPLPESMEVILGLMKGKYGGMMDAQSKTFDGMMSNLADWKDGTLRAIGAPIFEVLKDKLGGVLTFLGSPEVKNGISGFATSLSAGIGNALTIVTDLLGDFQDGLSEGGIGGGIAAFVGRLGEMLGASRETMDGVYTTITTAIGGAQTILTGVVTWVQANWPLIQTTFANVMTAVSGYITMVVGFITDPLIPGINSIIAAFAPVLAWVQANWPLIQTTIQTVITAIQTVIAVALPIIKTAFQVAFDGIKLIVDTVLPVILGIIKAAMQLINGDTTGALKTLQEVFGGAWEKIKTGINTAIEAIKPLVAKGMAEVKAEIVSLMGEAVTYMESLPAKFLELGSNIIKGMWEGISGMSQWFRDRFTKWLSATLPDWAQKLLGISSPSRVAADKIGAPFVQGIMQGIERGRGELQAVIGRVAGDMNFAAGGRLAMAGINTNGGNTYNVTVNTGPVSDRLDVEEIAYVILDRIRRAQ